MKSESKNESLPAGSMGGLWLGVNHSCRDIMSNTVVSSYKLLGVMVNTTSKWDDHVAVVMSETAKRLWFLRKQALPSKISSQAVIRPVLEYACPAWHSKFTKEQTKPVEDVQRRALQ